MAYDSHSWKILDSKYRREYFYLLAGVWNRINISFFFYRYDGLWTYYLHINKKRRLEKNLLDFLYILYFS